MGTQSITHPPRSLHAPLRIALFLLLSLASPLSAPAQTASVSALTVPLILPSAIVFDVTGNLYIAETGNHVIRKVDSAGNITTIAGTGAQGFSGDTGPATSATLDSPQGLVLDTKNNLYLADTHNHRIRKITATTGIITTIAGTGTQSFSGDNALATSAQLNLPTAIALDTAGNLYLADTGNQRIRKITATTGIITTIAGTGTQGFSGDTGPAISAAIDSPTGLAVDSANNLYLADTHNHRIRKITTATGIIATIAGTGTQGFSGDSAAATAATLTLPHGLTIDTKGNLYLADTANHRIRRIDATTGIITTAAGDGTQAFAGDGGPAITASLDSPRDTAASPSTLLTLSDTGNQRIRQLTAAPAPTTTIQTIAGIASDVLTLTAPSIIVYGTGQLTATIASATPAFGSITFFDTTSSTTTTLNTATLAANIATLPTTTLAAGQHNLTATYAGDQTHSAAQSSTFALTITPQQLIATIAPITLLYGQPIPDISGNLTGVLSQDATNLIAAFTTTATALSPTGTYPITATLTGPAAGNYTVASPAANLTINPASTLITLSNLIATSGSSITLTAHVASATTTGTFSGTVTLLDSGNPLFALPISASGDVVFTIPSITGGSHSFTAFYSGSINFTSSTSSPQLITVSTGPTTNPDFTLAPTGTTSQTIASGSSANYNFTVQLQGNMSSPIALAATGLPNLSTASFNPPTLPPGAASNAFTLTIATPNTTALENSRTRIPITWAFLLIPIATLTLRPRSYRAAAKLFTLVLLSLTLLLATGCGNRINTADALTLSAKSYTITVTGTATTSTGSILQHSATVTLLLEQPQ
jgi:sugar lactone lactonase YvrE